MDTRLRFALIATVLAVGGVTAALLGGDDSPKSFVDPLAGQPSCLDLPAPVPSPSWLPSTLPLPQGSYANQSFEAVSGIERVIITVNASIDDFVKFALKEWPAQGWELGRGEREPGEAESVFSSKNKKTYGQFRAREVYCKRDHVEVLIAYAEQLPSPTPTPQASISLPPHVKPSG